MCCLEKAILGGEASWLMKKSDFIRSILLALDLDKVHDSRMYKMDPSLFSFGRGWEWGGGHLVETEVTNSSFIWSFQTKKMLGGPHTFQ